MNKFTHLASAIITLAFVTTLCLSPAALLPTAWAKGDDHAGHDHKSEQEKPVDSHKKRDRHDGHDDHDDHNDKAVQFDAATLKEFGIVIQKAGPGPIGETVRLPGEVVFNKDLVAQVTPSVSGVVREVKLSVGDKVEAGQLMAVLSSRELAGARSAYQGSKARLVLERESLAREERLLADNIGTQRQLLEARKAVEAEKIALQLAQQNLHALGQNQADIEAIEVSTQTSFSEYLLKAPLSGLVIAREITRGEVVGIDPAKPPFVVADMSSVWVNFTVYQRDLTFIKPGMSVQIHFGHGIPNASGTIAFVSPSLEETTRTATARVILKNPKGQWRPGLFVTGMVTSGEESAAVVVPRSALQEVEGKIVVFIQDEDGFEARPVKLGRQGKDTVEIVDGLKAGERYVSKNGFAIKAEMNKASFGDGHNH